MLAAVSSLRLLRSAGATAARFPAVSVAQSSLPGWRRWLSDDLKAKIDKAVQDTPVLVFMKGTREAPQCGFSKAVVDILNMEGVDYKTVNVLADEDVRAGIKEYTSWPTIPQVFVKGEFVGGCDILMSMFKSGELEKLLLKEGLIEARPAEEPKA
ncbi:monothiol glutaredoxin grx5 [Phlyctochytrium bullatum]|nr:monothiol glutaredoxin grx5 [Phlyctochytrium bullatum]